MIEFPHTKREKTNTSYNKPQSIKQLEIDYLVYKQNLFPNQPYLAKKSFRDDTANGLTICIQTWCKLNKAHFQRQNSLGQYDAKLKKYRHSGGTKGISDILIIWKGISLNIEIKVGKDRQSNVQKKIQQSIQESGGAYLIVESFDNFLSHLKDRFNE